MYVEYVKWISAFSLLGLTTFFCSFPLWLRSGIRNGVTANDLKCKRLISLISCAGGGVFLATCLLHLFPEVKEQMEEFFKLSGKKPNFPVSEFIMAFGFLLVLIFEQIVLALNRETDGSPIIGHQHPEGDVAEGSSHHSHYGSISNDVENSDTRHSLHEDPSSHSPLRSVVLVFALSLHSIFEGFAIGLQSTSERVIRILAAVCIHKCIIAFTLGLNLSNSKLKTYVIWLSIAIFSSMSPIGTIVGSLISDLGSGVSMAATSGILQGIAAGTFLYVTFFEVLPHELNAPEDKITKVLFLVLGFSVMTLLVLFLPA